MTRVWRLWGFLLATAAAIQAVEVEQHRPHDFTFTAQVEGNPFAVDVRAEFNGPDGRQLAIPGFYDGNGQWKVRFSAPAPGEWTMRTLSPVAALHGKTESIQARPNTHRNTHGVLRVDPLHPYHFQFEDGSRFFLMGYEADWLWGADMLDPQRKLMRRLIDQIAARGFNYVIVNVYAHDTRWCPGKVNEWDYGPAPVYPWEGTNDKPDHERLNPRFFQIYDGMMEALREKGIVAHIMFKVYNKQVNWPAAGSAAEARFFRYVTARYQAYPNIVWDFAKESFYEKNNQLQRNLMELVRSTDAYRHMMGVHDDDIYEWDPKLGATLDLRIDQQHVDWEQMIAFDRAQRRRPVVNVEYSYELGVEPLPTHNNVNQVDWKLNLVRAYRILFAGGYIAYYYNNTAWDIVKPDPEPPGMARFQILKQLFESVPYWRMNPAPALAVGGKCLSDDATTMMCLAEGEQARAKDRHLTLNLMGFSGALGAEWVNTWTGERKAMGRIEAGVATIDYPADFGGAPAILILRR
ncbi:MAG: DUF4038 domain-containing protein [Acidobacteria bacterium]|nr:DUF4038 domain-containing protein [Acidobacteriota bacterium]